MTLLRESKESVIKMAPNVENALLFSLFSANLNIHPRDPTDQAPARPRVSGEAPWQLFSAAAAHNRSA
ncbi:MAG TPA: hypothetical protein VKC66_24245 [Xanthobacteraceae bacterium]|nr:hypothetical protein [Xanthobacteraceae bacterium]